MDAGLRLTSTAFAYGEIVWSDAPMQASSSKAANAARERWCHEKQGHRTISYKP